MTSREVIASAAGTRDVNCTCNVIHVARASLFNTNSVLDKIAALQGMLDAGSTLPPDVAANIVSQSGISWLGDDSSDVVGCSWAKDIDSVVGTMSVQLKPRTPDYDYVDIILPGDLLIVFMDDVGTYTVDNRISGTLVSVVVVDRVGEITGVENGATVTSVSVTARDLAVVLSESSTVFDQAFAQLDNGMYTGAWMNLLFGNKKQFSLSPTENILNLLLLLFSSNATKSDEFPQGSVLSQLQWKLSPNGTETSNEDHSLDTLAALSQVVSLIDVTTYMQTPMPFYALAKPPAIIQAGNVWSLLQSYANTAINEFFLDVRDNNSQAQQFRDAQSKFASDASYAPSDEDVTNQATAIQTVLDDGTFRATTATSSVALVMRQRPYDQDTFNNLPFTIVDSTEVIELQVARSSHDVLNWFRVKFPDLPVSMQEFVAGITIAPQSIAKFGYRRMDAETIYMFASSEGAVTFQKGNTKTDFADVFLAYTDILSGWFSQNEYWFAGQMMMRFKPSIRVGTRLRFTRDNQVKYEFYVQGVQHNFVASVGASRTMLTLTRGRTVDAPPVPVIFQQQGIAFSAAQAPRTSPASGTTNPSSDGPTLSNTGSIFGGG